MITIIIRMLTLTMKMTMMKHDYDNSTKADITNYDEDLPAASYSSWDC